MAAVKTPRFAMYSRSVAVFFPVLVLSFVLLLFVGCASSQPTIQRYHLFGTTYQFSDSNFRDRVTFRVPQPWKLSHWPKGGIAGVSSFGKSESFGTVLLVQATADPSSSFLDTADSIMSAFEKDDRETEPERVRSGFRLVQSLRKLHPQAEIQDQPDSDLAVVQKVGQSRLQDGRVIPVFQISSPSRAAWLQAWIPYDGFSVSIGFYPWPGSVDTDGLPLISTVLESFTRGTVKSARK